MRYNYAYDRLRSLPRHLISLRGLLLSLALLAAFVAYVSSGWLQVLAFSASVASAAILSLTMSLRLSDQHRKIQKLKGETRNLTQERLQSRPSKEMAHPQPQRDDQEFGFDQAAVESDRLLRNRRKVASARAALALRGVLPSTSGDAMREPAPVDDAGVAVSIVLSCYNQGSDLEDVLESIRRQSLANWECIIVDDASTDASPAEAWRYVSIDDRFRLVRHKTSQGVNAARNTGLRLATGTFVTFVDPDDLLLEDSLLDRLEAISQEDRRDVAGSFCGVHLVAEEAILELRPSTKAWSRSRFVDFVSAGGEAPFIASATLVRTDLARAVGGFDETTKGGPSDWGLWLRLMRNGYWFVPSRHASVRRLLRDGSADNTDVVADAVDSSALTLECHEPAKAGIITAPAAYPLPQDLAHYQATLSIARSRLPSAALAFVRGDRPSCLEILSELDPSCLPLLARHLNVDAEIRAGLARGLGLDGLELDGLEEDLQPMVDEIARDLRRAAAAQPAAIKANHSPEIDVLLCPQAGYQALAMLDLADSIGPEVRVAFLGVDSVDGDQGVSAVLSESHADVYSLNEWLFQGLRYRQLVVAFPRGAATEELIVATSSAGGSVVEIVLGGEETMRVPDTPTHDLNPLRLGADEYLARFVEEEMMPDAPVAPAVGNVRGAPWTGVVDPSPDDAFKVEEKFTKTADGPQIEEFRDRHRSERCVIIGNGPSLNLIDLTRLAGENTFGVNGIFYASEKMGFDPTYYVVEDTMVVSDNLEEIKAFKAGHKFFPSIYREQVGSAANVSYFMMNRAYYEKRSPAYCVPRFSTDAAQRIYSGQSVTTVNLQLAYYMGFSEVVLIGMDFSYTVPAGSKIDGDNILSLGDDPNHFHPEYFGRGKTWKDPKLDRVLANYQLAKLMYEADGRRIVNATPGGNLDLFERISYQDLVG